MQWINFVFQAIRVNGGSTSLGWVKTDVENAFKTPDKRHTLELNYKLKGQNLTQ